MKLRTNHEIPPSLLLVAFTFGVQCFKASAQCIDTSTGCKALAMAGECETNAQYMSVACKASCSLCDSPWSSMTFSDEAAEDLNSVPLLFIRETDGDEKSHEINDFSYSSALDEAGEASGDHSLTFLAWRTPR